MRKDLHRMGAPGIHPFDFFRDEPSKKIHFWLYFYIRIAIVTFDRGMLKYIQKMLSAQP